MKATSASRDRRPPAAGRGRPRSWLLPAGAALLLIATASSASAQDWRTLARSRDYRGETALAVNIEYGAGRLVVKPAGESVLYRTSLRYDADAFEPRFEYAEQRLRLGIASGKVKGRKHAREGRLELQVGPRVPLDLDLQFGAAEAEIELGGLRLRRLHVATGASATRLQVSTANLIEAETIEIEAGAAKLDASGLANLRARKLEVSGGVGEVVLDFSGAWTRDLEASIEMGMGTVTIRVPRGLGVRVSRSGFLSGFDSEGLIKRGNVYYSENYEGAAHHLDVDLQAALGSVRIVWLDG